MLSLIILFCRVMSQRKRRNARVVKSRVPSLQFNAYRENLAVQ